MPDELSTPTPIPTPPKQKKGLKTHLNASFDPTKPLKNLKHEKLARKIALDPKKTQTEAYLEVYSTNEPDSARASASEILAKPNVRERVLALMSKDRPILEKVSERVNQHIDGDNAPVSMDACKTVLKIAGTLDEQKIAESSYNPVQINFIVKTNRETNTPNLSDSIEIQSNES
jgi:hypothetical protein